MVVPSTGLQERSWVEFLHQTRTHTRSSCSSPTFFHLILTPPCSCSTCSFYSTCSTGVVPPVPSACRILKKKCRRQPSLDNMTSQLWSDATCPGTTSSRALLLIVMLLSLKRQDKVLEEVVHRQVAVGETNLLKAGQRLINE